MSSLDPQNVLYLVSTVNPKIADDVDIFSWTQIISWKEY